MRYLSDPEKSRTQVWPCQLMSYMDVVKYTSASATLILRSQRTYIIAIVFKICHSRQQCSWHALSVPVQGTLRYSSNCIQSKKTAGYPASWVKQKSHKQQLLRPKNRLMWENIRRAHGCHMGLLLHHSHRQKLLPYV